MTDPISTLDTLDLTASTRSRLAKDRQNKIQMDIDRMRRDSMKSLLDQAKDVAKKHNLQVMLPMTPRYPMYPPRPIPLVFPRHYSFPTYNPWQLDVCGRPMGSIMDMRYDLFMKLRTYYGDKRYFV